MSGEADGRLPPVGSQNDGSCGGCEPPLRAVVLAAYADLGRIADDVRRRLAGAQHVDLIVGPPGVADLAVLDCLSRLALAAVRGAGRLRVTAADEELRPLLELVGLDSLLEPPRRTP